MSDFTFDVSFASYALGVVAGFIGSYGLLLVAAGSTYFGAAIAAPAALASVWVYRQGRADE